MMPNALRCDVWADVLDLFSEMRRETIVRPRTVLYELSPRDFVPTPMLAFFKMAINYDRWGLPGRFSPERVPTSGKGAKRLDTEQDRGFVGGWSGVLTGCYVFCLFCCHYDSSGGSPLLYPFYILLTV